MRKPRLETTDRVALVISLLMFVAGFAGLLVPDDFIVSHTAMRGKGAPNYTVLEHITPARARFYGLGSIVVGAILATYVLWATNTE